MSKLGLKIIPFLFFLVLSVFFWRGLSLNPHEIPSVQLGHLVPDFTLPQLSDSGTLFHSNQLRDRVVLLNVWASWCSACVDEQAFLMQLAREGIIMYGLNYKDKPTDAINWLTQWGNPYKEVFQDREGVVSIDLGVYGAPETFVIDKKGIIRYRHAGIMNKELWVSEVLPLMKKLEQAV